jgi:hypothetical protein
MTRFIRFALAALCAVSVGCSDKVEGNRAPRQRSNATKSPLELAIERGSQPGGDLAEEIDNLGDYSISKRSEAVAVCEALSRIPYAAESEKVSSDFYRLTGLFQGVQDPDTEGFRVLRTEGTAQLLRIFDASLNRDDADEDDLLFVLKILAAYGTREGADRVVAAARKPVSPDGYMWSVILETITPDHPQRKYVFEKLQKPLPEEFIAIALLDSANAAAMAGEADDHPFDSEEGAQRLREWLENEIPDEASHAVSATAALPFIGERWRAPLLDLAARHPEKQVGLEAAWARVKSGDQVGVEQLALLCMDPDLSKQAQRYLEELGHADAIPKDATDPDFLAKAEFANWLSHPSELGRPPDKLEIVDRRTLKWPPEREPKPFWLIRYLLRDTTGLDNDDVNCGLVGSMTWCFFSYDLDQRPPEDSYAIHCYWELAGQDLITEEDVANPKEHAGMLSQWSRGELESPRIVKVADLDSSLDYPQQRVGLASAKLAGKEGWVVLDGPRSAWYDPRDFPGTSPELTLLDVHIGRQLLGFTGPANRASYLKPRPARDPREVAENYERLLGEVERGAEERRIELLSAYNSPLLTYFGHYIEARTTLDGKPKTTILVPAYERVLRAVQSIGPAAAEEAIDALSPLTNHFGEYVDALVAANRQADVEQLIEFFAPHWDHNLGYGLLGTAAFKIGKLDQAEAYFVRLHNGLKEYPRAEEMSYLAEIWEKQGKAAEARELLVDCLQKLVVMVKESEYADSRRMYEETFQLHRQTFLRLFPDFGESELGRQGIPATTVQ